MNLYQKITMSSLRTILPAAILAGLAMANAHGQIGSGWTSYSPSKSLQLRGSGAYSSSGGVETFKITNASTTTEERAEQRVQDDYSSGQRQFEGRVKVVSLGGTAINLKQTFQAKNGAFFLLAVKSGSGGQLYDHGNSGAGTFISNVIGATVRVNTVHKVGGTLQLYINGSLKETRSGGSSPWYNKYGAYRAASGHGPITVQWSGIKFWKK